MERGKPVPYRVGNESIILVFHSYAAIIRKESIDTYIASAKATSRRWEMMDIS
jgi:hypothetical protein